MVLMYLHADSFLYMACSLLNEFTQSLIFCTAAYISLDVFPPAETDISEETFITDYCRNIFEL